MRKDLEQHEVVISGMNGSFPGCDTVEEFTKCLFDKINLVTDKGRWQPGELSVPHQIGTINDTSLIDLTFFGIHRKFGGYMDPNVKLTLRNAIGAIYDAGLNINDIFGSTTATIVGTSVVETEFEVYHASENGQTILSNSVCMEANRLSYFLDLKGPSFVCESGFNGCMSGLQYARNLIARGSVKSAFVVGSNALFLPQISYHYYRLGRLNEDGKTKCFSNDADGYSRSECCIVFFLQRKEDALRNYGTILGVSNSETGSRNGTCVDSSLFDVKKIELLYKEINIDPSEVAYLEASGSASKIVDAKELNECAKIFLANRKEPLPIGSVKSNAGHTESCSGFLGIVKALIAAENDLIPPNIHYSSPNSSVPELVSGRLKVVTEPEILKGDLLAVNNISSFSGLAHAVIRKNPKKKQRKCEVGVLPPDGLARIVLLTGRDLSSIEKKLEEIESMPIDEEFVALTHRCFSKGFKKHMFRGYTVLNDEGLKLRQTKECHGREKKALWFLFAGMGSQWPGMGKDLMRIPTFAKAIHLCHSYLEPYGVDLISVVTSKDPKIFDEVLNCFIGITAMQIGLVDILKEINFVPDGILGHSLGEAGCAYFDGAFTHRQAIMSAYFRGKVSAESNAKGGLMAAVGKGYDYLKDKVPADIDIACRNSSTSCTISGPAESIHAYIEELSKQGIFVRAVQSGNIAYHSRYIQHLGPAFLEALKKEVPEPKMRSSKWISSSVPKEKWNTQLAKYSSAEYLTNNLLSPVLFEDALKHVPKDAIIVEIAPRPLLQAIIKRALPAATCIPITTTDNYGHLFLINAFGKLFNEGVFVDVEKLYPPVEFPVSRGTPSLGSLLTFEHSETWTDFKFLQKKKKNFTSADIFFNDNAESKYTKFSDYLLHDTPYVSPSAYLDIVLEMHKCVKNDNTYKILTIENIVFKKTLNFGDEEPALAIFQRGTGSWEISVSSGKVASGKVETFLLEICDKIRPSHSPHNLFNQEEIYSNLARMGLNVGCNFKNIQIISLNQNVTNAYGEILWKGDYLSFFDSIFVFLTFFNSYKKHKLNIMSQIQQINIDPAKFCSNITKVVKVTYDSNTRLLWADGLEVSLPITKDVSNRTSGLGCELLVPRFLPVRNEEVTKKNVPDFLEQCLKIVFNNIPFTEDHMKKLEVLIVSKSIQEQQEIYSLLTKCHEGKASSTTNFLTDSNLMFDSSGKCHCLIYNQGPKFDNSLKILHENGGFLISKTPISLNKLKCILKQKFRNETHFLYNYVEELSEQTTSVFVKSKEWKMDLLKQLTKSNVRTVFLISYYSSLSYIHDVVQQCSNLTNYNLIRFIFLEDNSDAFKPELHKDHLANGLRVNVMKNGEWGTLAFYPLQVSSKISLREDFPLYEFKYIKSGSLHLNALGLNKESLNDRSSWLGVFEYSGMKDGKEICGLASLNEDTTSLFADPILVWNKPTNWSHEDAASVLLTYAMAYEIINTYEYDRIHEGANRIFINNGATLLSTIVIKLALSKNYKVYTSYTGNISNKKYIKQLCPQIDESNIFGEHELTEKILQKNNNRGVDLCVYYSDNTNALPIFRFILNPFSTIIQISSVEIPAEKTLGLNIFLKSVQYHVISGKNILNLTKDEKQNLWKLMDTGFKKGEIVPCTISLIPPTCTNLDVINQIQCEHEAKKKTVVTMNSLNLNNHNKNLYICDNEKFYIIFGDEHTIWLDLIHWLITRGGRKFIILVKNSSVILSKSLNNLLNGNKYIQINLSSTDRMNTPDRAYDFIKQTQKQAKIGAIFAFGKVACEIVNEITKAFDETQIVQIGKELQTNTNIGSGSQKCLTISMSSHHLDLRIALENLDSLITSSHPVVYLNENTSGTIDLSHFSSWTLLPDSASDFEYLARSSGKAHWKEVKTNSSRFQFKKDVPPVFILPSLKKGQLDPLIKKINYSAFVAVIPQKFKGFDDLAEQLYKALEELNCEVFTIVCPDWSSYLGHALGRLIEKNGKEVSLILFNINTSWANQKVLKRIHNEVEQTLPKDSSKNSNKKRPLVKQGFEVLMHRIEHMNKSSLCDVPQLNGLCHLVAGKNMYLSESSMREFSEHCKLPIRIHQIKSEDYSETISSPEAAEVINANTLVECKDRARDIIRDHSKYIQAIH